MALERAGDAPGVASVDTNLGLLQSRSGQPALALQSFERAIDVFERYGVRDSLAASLLAKARTQLLLADNAASLDTSRRARNLAQQLENPVLLRNIAQQLAEALTANGQLQEAARVLEQAPAAVAPDDGIADARAQLALERGEPAQALAAVAAAPATDAAAQLLAVRAALASGPVLDAALRQRIQANLQAAPDDQAASDLAQALWLDAAGDRPAATARFAAALAKADARGDVSTRIEVLAAWITALLRHGELDRATELAGQIVPLIERDYRAARAAALYYRAVGDRHLQAAAETSLHKLAGERPTALP